MKALFLLRGGARANAMCDATVEGMRRVGDNISVSRRWDGTTDKFDCIIGYSWMFCSDAFLAYKRAGKKFIYIDLGYWARRPPGKRWTGHHKIVVNGRHPTEYFRMGNPPDRFNRLGVRIKPWRKKGSHILIAGMSAKASETHGLGTQEWERQTAKRLRAVTDRPLLYRPKPSWSGASPLPHCTMVNRAGPIESYLREAWAVVTHHSNVAVDALVNGVPVYAQEGVGSVMSMNSLEDIESPYYPDDREGFLADVAYCQWDAEEMAKGLPWRFFKEKGLIP